MKNSSTIEKIKVWDRGQITLPKDLREKLEIKKNDILYVEKLGDGLYLRPKESVIVQVQKKMSALVREKGLKVNDLLDED